MANIIAGSIVAELSCVEHHASPCRFIVFRAEQ